MEKNLFANPAPLGLMGFGMATVLLNLHNAGIYALGSMILAMGIFYGGLAQIFAGLLEFRRRNTFGTVAFSSYGLFWLSLVALIVIPKIVPGISSPSSTAIASYFFFWGVFTFAMFFSTLAHNRALQFVFLSLAILFWLLTVAELTGIEAVLRLAGYEGIICGLSAMYLSIALVTNETYGKEVLPIGEKR